MVDRLDIGGLIVLKERLGIGRALHESWGEADLLFNFGSGSDALLYAALLVPEFIEIEGFVFLKHLGVGRLGGSETMARQIREAQNISIQAVSKLVSSYNWIEIPSLFANPSGVEEVYEILANVVAEAWRGRLAHLFPHKRYVVRVIDPKETGGWVGVGFAEE